MSARPGGSAPDFCAEYDNPLGTIKGTKTGRPKVWRSLPGFPGHEYHPDGRIRDRHRHVINHPSTQMRRAVDRELYGPAPVVVLACCGIRWRYILSNGKYLPDPRARIHQIDCLENMTRETPHGRPGRSTTWRSRTSGRLVRKVDPAPRPPLASQAPWGDLLVVLNSAPITGRSR